MITVRSLVKCVALVFGLVLVNASSVHAFDAPLQANVAISMASKPGAASSYSARLEGGVARVFGTVRNQLDGQAAQIDVEFEYKTGAPVSLDEIIEGIEVLTETIEGGAWGFASITPNYINLNPNRVTLSYRVTLYYPQQLSYGYVARVRVYGNYE